MPVAHNQPEGEVVSNISRINYSLLPLTSNYPTTQPLLWPFLFALAELQWLATNWSGKHGPYFHVF
jgi:hypothetical protein